MERTCWFDEVGEKWEAEGVDPSCIFEFHQRLADDCMEGGMVEMTTPGDATSPLNIKRVLVRLKNGDEVGGGKGWPLFLANWERIKKDLC